MHTSVNQLKSYTARLETFKKWNHKFLTKENMARLGFYSLQTDDFCACAYCNIVVYDLANECNAGALHYKVSPGCTFLKQENLRVITAKKESDGKVIVFGPFEERMEISKVHHYYYHAKASLTGLLISGACAFGLYSFAKNLFFGK